MTAWSRCSWAASAQAIHDLTFPLVPCARRDRYRLDRPALVFGSSQRAEYDWSVQQRPPGFAGHEVAIRRSGGGVVNLDPDRGLWIDIWIPDGFADWAADLTRTFLQVGEYWRRAFADLDVAADVVTDGPDRHAPTAALARKVCYAGLGWGEVLVAGSKVIGLSQRRTRWGARVQCLVDFSPSRGAAGLLGQCSAEDVAVLHDLGLFAAIEGPNLDALAAAFDRHLLTD